MPRAAMLNQRDVFQVKGNGRDGKNWGGQRQSSAPPQEEVMVMEASSMSCARASASECGAEDPAHARPADETRLMPRTATKGDGNVSVLSGMLLSFVVKAYSD